MGQPTNPFDPDISLNGQAFQAYMPKQFKAGLSSAPATSGSSNAHAHVVNKEGEASASNNSKMHNKDPVTRHGGVCVCTKNYRHLDVVGVSYFIILLIVMVMTSLCLTIPVVHADSVKFHTLLVWFIVFNTVTNFIMIIMNRSVFDPSWSSTPVQYLPDPTWKKCLDCQHPSPPRSHHCTLCQKCILKRDHHCFFVASCIGFHNQRYFLVYCFYIAFGSIYNFYLTWIYLGTEYVSPLGAEFYNYFLPITLFQATLGYVSCTFLGLVFLSYLSFVTGIGAVAMFVFQMYLAFIGITSHEYSNSVAAYKSGKLMRNIRSVFGHYWLFNFFFPVPCFSSYGDGIDWPQQSKYI